MQAPFTGILKHLRDLAPWKSTFTFNKGKARCMNYYGLIFSISISSATLSSDVCNFTIRLKLTLIKMGSIEKFNRNINTSSIFQWWSEADVSDFYQILNGLVESTYVSWRKTYCKIKNLFRFQFFYFFLVRQRYHSNLRALTHQNLQPSFYPC